MSSRSPAGIVEQLGGLEVVVCAGSGGVGKTTVSAALGLAMVAELDRRVLVLTVDPARRLATALGLGRMGAEPVPVTAARLRKAGIQPKGELVAAMLDMKSAWDLMVERHSPTRESAERILANRFYQGISNAFVGSQDWMAMETLYELHAGREYDTVVIDTPPSRNALDFLEAPNRLSDFVGARLLSWLAGPSRLGWRAINVAAAPFARMAGDMPGQSMSGCGSAVPARVNRCRRSLRSSIRARAMASATWPDTWMSRACSSHVYQVTPTPASCATSSRRRPGVRRRRAEIRPTLSGVIRSRRLRTNAASSLRRTSSSLVGKFGLARVTRSE